ncbi:MAG TPA: antibiotic biosynthesis monooxygenase [Acidimicrobiales bacterium]|nr:antibiotic biosynthesis monooxygenase [Acidimicrobiales bacterium]
MVLEHAVLEVVAGREAAFEEAFAEAKILISSAEGFRSLRLSRCLEQPNRYLLLVEWDRLEDHTEGFRRSAAYGRWRELLHHFYDPFPTVEHYATHLHIGAPATDADAAPEVGRG